MGFHTPEGFFLIREHLWGGALVYDLILLLVHKSIYLSNGLKCLATAWIICGLPGGENCFSENCELQGL